MTRIVKTAAVRRAEIIETAQRLFLLKGYEQTSVSDITGAIGIAKGTFYHHFSSKLDVLDALIDRLLVQSLEILHPIVEDSRLSALQKFNRLMSDSLAFKTENIGMFRVIMPVWFGDDNAIWRERTKEESLRQISPLLAQIIHQGVEEGSFAVSYPDRSAEIVLHIGQNLSDSLARQILSLGNGSLNMQDLESTLAAHKEAITRVLGARKDSIELVDIDGLRPFIEADRG